MALALPYPDMDFVPLDILLASELNQMVANIEFLASDDVFPVKADNIDFSSLPSAQIYVTTSISNLSWGAKIAFDQISKNTNTSDFSLSSNGVKVATAGVYEVSAQVSGYFAANTGWISVRLNSDSTKLATAFNRHPSESYGSVFITPFRASLNANDVVYLYTDDPIQNLNSGIGSTLGSYLSIKRVG